MAINPYKRFPIYTQRVIKMYIGKRRNEVPPHIFCISDGAYMDMLTSKYLEKKQFPFLPIKIDPILRRELLRLSVVLHESTTNGMPESGRQTKLGPTDACSLSLGSSREADGLFPEQTDLYWGSDELYVVKRIQ